jgi:hypothetical protein
MIQTHIASLRARIATLNEQKRSMTERVIRMDRRAGRGPWVETTRDWRAELDRRIGELTRVIAAFD